MLSTNLSFLLQFFFAMYIIKPKVTTIPIKKVYPTFSTATLNVLPCNISSTIAVICDNVTNNIVITGLYNVISIDTISVMFVTVINTILPRPTPYAP